MKLSDYIIEKSFASTTGDCYIATSKEDEQRYFIKKNIFVNYGTASDPIELKRKFKQNADSWLSYHNSIKEEFKKIGNGTGTIIFPVAYFVDDGKIYELSHYIEINKLAVSDREKKHPSDIRVCELGFDEKIRILQTSAYALMQIHSLGIIHCDLKPDNIPISKSEMGNYISKITDCGDAVFAADIPDESQIMCTEPYWSPELASYKMGNTSVKNRLSCKNDVFALGLIFHEWWTGDLPYFEGRDKFVALYQVVHRSWPNKIKIDESVPRWLGDLILDMLYPEPEKRPSMEVVIGAIKSRSYTSPIRDTSKQGESKFSFDELKQLMACVPKGDDVQKYTEESYSTLAKLVGLIKANINKITTQEQVDKLSAELRYYIDNLVKRTIDDRFKKIDNAISIIESKNLSIYTPESRNNLLQLVDLAKKQKTEATDQHQINMLYVALSKAYKDLVVMCEPSIKVVEPIPAPYTKVEILSDDEVMAYYGNGGKIKFSVDNAVKMKLVVKK